MRLTPLFTTLLLLSAATAGAQGTRTGARQPVQGVVVRRGPVSSTSADTLVECVPIASPARTAPAPKPVHRPRPATTPRHKVVRKVAKAPVHKAAPKPRAKPKARPAPKHKLAARPAPKHPRKPVVHHRPRRPVVAAANNTTRRANLPALVMCRPIHPVAPSNLGPLPETMVPIPEVASVAPPVAPLPVEEVPSYIAAASPHSRFLPLALVPAFFIPFIHGGHGNAAPVDTTTPTPPPTPPPPTTVPEPSSLALLGTGLLALGGVSATRRKKRHDD